MSPELPVNTCYYCIRGTGSCNCPRNCGVTRCKKKLSGGSGSRWKTGPGKCGECGGINGKHKTGYGGTYRCSKAK